MVGIVEFILMTTSSVTAGGVVWGAKQAREVLKKIEENEERSIQNREALRQQGIINERRRNNG